MNADGYRSELKNAKKAVVRSNIANVILATGLVFVIWWHLENTKNEIHHFIPPDLYAPFTYQGHYYSESYYRQVAEYFTGMIENFTPETYEHLIVNFVEYAAPEKRGTLIKQFKKQMKIVKDRSSSQSFSIKKTIVRGNQVAVVGNKRTFIGSRIVTNDLDAYIVTIKHRKDGMITIYDYKRAEDPQDPFNDRNQ